MKEAVRKKGEGRREREREREEGWNKDKFSGDESDGRECVIPCFINPLIATFGHVHPV